MSVLKRKRKESQFEVFAHLVRLRRDITDLLLRDFGYSRGKAENRLTRMFGGRGYDELDEDEKLRYSRAKKRDEAFHAWFIYDQRKAVVECLRDIQTEVYIANSIYPMYMEELVERRLHQDRAIGHCYRLIQELQYAIETLPVDVNVYLRFAEGIQTEIDLIKGWRKSDNKFKRAISDSAANFSNVAAAGSVHRASANDAGGVRPAFNPAV